MRSWHILACLMLLATMLTACGGTDATETNEPDLSYESDVLDSEGADGLDAASQLALGTLMLEGTDQAVTSDQAQTLLPLWQALQGGVTAEDEIKAVLRGIEGAMTEEQLAAIADKELDQESMQSWMEQQGVGRLDGFPGAGDMSEEEREAARATRRAGGGGAMPSRENAPPDMGTRVAEFESMSEEEQEAMMATAQASGGVGPGFHSGQGGGVATAGGGLGRVRLLLRPLIEMLTERVG